MHPSTYLPAALWASLIYAIPSCAETVNRTLTNGYGSTPSERHYINHTQALTVINSGIAKAIEIKSALSHFAHNLSQLANSLPSVPMNIAVLDPSATLVAFLHMDNSYLGSIDISQKKAKTVADFNGLFQSSGLYNRSQTLPGSDVYGIEQTNGGLVVFGGGQPIYDPMGYFIGAVG
ncbi:hypothetical protein LTR95_018564, partial [Oleoguttula sp. CCFEE 5521]